MSPSHSGNAAQEALDAGAWEQARLLFQQIATESGDPEAFEGVARAAWWIDDADSCVGAWESAYRGHKERGDDRGAARAATALAWDARLFGRGDAVARGWLGLARELLDSLGESSEHGWFLVREAELALAMTHDPEQALRSAREAVAVGRRTDDEALRVVGDALTGLSQTAAGDVVAGMAYLDRAVAAATSGAVADPMWMGKVCCWLIAACGDTHDVVRASEWCLRVEEICVQQDLVPLFNVCRIQFASVQVEGGTWIEAETELTDAIGRLSTSRRSSRLDATVQLGELRRRQGRLDEADELFSQAEFHPTAVLGRALIRLDTGDPQAAWAAVSALLRSIPVEDRLTRADLLSSAVRIALAADRLTAAAVAADELRGTAAVVKTDPLLAAAAAADACLADGVEAVALLRDAVHRFHRSGLRYDEAVSRVLLAQALFDTHDVAGAREQLDLATKSLTVLGASADLALAERLDRLHSPGRDGPLTPREREVLALVAQGRSNAGIAAALVVSEHTVHRHVSNILTKLDQPTRAGAVAHAMKTGILPV